VELVGKALAYREENGCLRVVFRCTNKEEFDLIQAPAINRIPPGTLVRAWTQRTQNELGALTSGSILVHWEELS
jgi:hypothetical protein